MERLDALISALHKDKIQKKIDLLQKNHKEYRGRPCLYRTLTIR